MERQATVVRMMDGVLYLICIAKALAGTGSDISHVSFKVEDVSSLNTIQESKSHYLFIDLGAFSTSLVLHANDNVWRLWVFLLSLRRAVVGISALGGSAALVAVFGPINVPGQYMDRCQG